MKTKYKAKYKISILAVVLAATAFLVGCTTPEETIEQKVVSRWEAIIAADYEKAYEYLSPSYREVESLTSYSVRMETAKIHVQWAEPKFASKECDEELCTVKVSLSVKYSFPRKSMGKAELVTEVNENWIKKENGWYFLPKK